MLVRLGEFGFATASALMLAAMAPSAFAQTDELPNGPGKTQLVDVCTQCHAIGIVIAQDRAPEEWAEIMQRMIGMGAPANPDQQHAILGYLQQNFAKPGEVGAKTSAASPVLPPKPSLTPSPGPRPPTPSSSLVPRNPATTIVATSRLKKSTVTRTITVTKIRPHPRVGKPRP